MKNMLKEFFSVKGTTPMVVKCIIISLVYAFLNTRVTIWIANVLENANDYSMMIHYLTLVLIEFTITTVISFFRNKYTKLITEVAFTELSNRVARKILDSDYDAFTKNGESYMQTILQSTGSVSEAGRLCMDLFNSSVNFIVLTISLCIIEIELIIPITIIYSIGALVTYKYSKKINKIDEKNNKLKHTRNDEVQKIISGFAEVRSNGTETYHYSRIMKYNNDILDCLIRKTRYVASMNMSFEMVDSFITTVVILFSIVAIPQGLATSVAMTMVIYAWRLLGPLIDIVFTIDENSARLVDFKKYKEFMDSEITIKDGKIKLESFDSSIRFENVGFKYRNSDTVLDCISFTVRKGEKIGICGHSGGGKSTLMKLIPRFYDTTEGSILIDGIDIKEFTLSSLRNKIGIVHQANYIFKGTIKENIAYGISSVTETDLIAACKKANIYDFIKSLPEGFDTDVGPNGLKLSGGQQQRVSLARIFLNQPDIILLDEATSALDNESEAIVQEALNMFSDKTIITVAHRLSTIKDSDKIFVVDEHKIVESGTHQELLDKHGFYYNLYSVKQ